MPNQSIQFPNIDLPQAEYFSLSPNRTIAIQGRRRAFPNQTLAIAASATTTITASAQIESGFPVGAGIYIHSADGVLAPLDASAQLAILSIRMGLSITGLNNIGYDMGSSQAAISSTVASTQIVIAERDKLVTTRDMQAFEGGPGAGLPLFATIAVTLKNNDATNPHSANIGIKIVYTRLDGIVE